MVTTCKLNRKQSVYVVGLGKETIGKLHWFFPRKGARCISTLGPKKKIMESVWSNLCHLNEPQVAWAETEEKITFCALYMLLKASHMLFFQMDSGQVHSIDGPIKATKKIHISVWFGKTKVFAPWMLAEGFGIRITMWAHQDFLTRGSWPSPRCVAGRLLSTVCCAADAGWRSIARRWWPRGWWWRRCRPRPARCSRAYREPAIKQGQTHRHWVVHQNNIDKDFSKWSGSCCLPMNSKCMESMDFMLEWRPVQRRLNVSY